ncbi:ribonuclease III [Ilumatobacter sp.]|uniref:ribonuclease III n=1 Tax=Ilumatobacter sp. TaxID=1967498 RepID=UPI003B52184E
MSLAALAERLGHTFERPELLDRALAHRSWCAENGAVESNERLEFLGDAVLGWAVADIVYGDHPEVDEGRLSLLRIGVVNAGALATVATTLGLGDHVKLGKGEAAGGGAAKPSILSDTFEAVLGAVYLDGGAEAAHALVHRHVAPLIEQVEAGRVRRDPKTELQELCARRGTGAPSYAVTSTGPDHAKRFAAEVSVDGEVVGRGEATSKKGAEQVAATAATDALG